MTLDEAKKVARIVETAEGGCGGCINEALAALIEAFPLFDWKMIEPPHNPIWPVKFDYSIEVSVRNVKAPPRPGYARRYC